MSVTLARAAQGEVLAYYRAMELLLSDGVEHALAEGTSEVAALGGQVHEAAHRLVSVCYFMFQNVLMLFVARACR
jgi:hypothetical protein